MITYFYLSSSIDSLMNKVKIEPGFPCIPTIYRSDGGGQQDPQLITVLFRTDRLSRINIRVIIIIIIIIIIIRGGGRFF